MPVSHWHKTTQPALIQGKIFLVYLNITKLYCFVGISALNVFESVFPFLLRLLDTENFAFYYVKTEFDNTMLWPHQHESDRIGPGLQ